VVLQSAPGEFVALSAVCTHLGCVVAWQEQAGEFLCPCHGGRFSAAGQVLGGPPPAPLETLAVELDGDQLKIG
jgi:cytochrome b6-f complex iron-sulfur subunit